MRVVVALVVLLLARGARDYLLDPRSGTALALGVLLIVGYVVGEWLERLRLPRITGYLLTGLAIGPHGLGLIGGELGTLTLFNGTAIALIALTAGSELDLRALRPLARPILAIVIAGVVAAAAAIAATALGVRALGGPFADLPATEAIVVCGMLGVVLAAQSPAVIVAIRRETGARGPLSETALGAVIVGDVVVIVLFAVLGVVAQAALDGATSLGAAAVHLTWHVLGSLGIGAAVGLALGAWLRAAHHGAPVLVVLACVVLAEIGERVALDPIVVAVTAGALIRNRIRGAYPALEHGLDAVARPTYVVFFAVAGAGIHLDELAAVAGPAIALVLARAAGLLAGARAGAALAGAPQAVRRDAGYGLLPQAGLALALALVFAEAFPDLGPAASGLALAVVALNELIAPAIWRAVLVRSGEADADRRAEATAPDARPPSSAGRTPRPAR